ncbi:MAG: putative ferredoxin [Leptospirillum sp. Group IV 'UBA BS']|nr:MAG: putative ferredoxin [Leptospirillum sp. Group IV 'UBA BS']
MDLGLPEANDMMNLPGCSWVAGGAIFWRASSCLQAGPCGSCEELCPTGVLDLGQFDGGLLEPEDSVCIRCRLCLMTCPTGALSFSLAAVSSSRNEAEAVVFV